MSTVVINTTITGKIGTRAVSITLSYSIADVDYVLERIGRVGKGSSMSSLDETGATPPTIDNSQLVYLRMDTLADAGTGEHNIDTAAGASNGRFLLMPGECAEFHRADAGGIFAENATATTSAMQVLGVVEQLSLYEATNVGLFAAFKPIS